MGIFFCLVDITWDFGVQENEVLKILISAKDYKLMYKKSQPTPTTTS